MQPRNEAERKHNSSRHFHRWLLAILVSGGVIAWYIGSFDFRSRSGNSSDTKQSSSDSSWEAPDTAAIPDNERGALIWYGRELVAETSKYLGPDGEVSALSNGMNCQNCHLDAGTKPFGNNFSAVASTYPKFRARSGTMETIDRRINDCLQRSLNGKPLDTASREMKALAAYILWVGEGVPRGTTPAGSGLSGLRYLDRAADPRKGEIVYLQQCAVCHGKEGQGMENPGTDRWLYPPLWGTRSYNTAAGLYRLSRLANYVKYNMPFGIDHRKPRLSDAQAWDVAAFINAQPRPEKSFREDWPDVTKKPVDHPFGPFADSFPAHQHKYGPFAPIEAAQAKH